MKKNGIRKNKVLLENERPKVLFTDESEQRGGVDVEEAKKLAFEVAMKIININGNNNQTSN